MNRFCATTLALVCLSYCSQQRCVAEIGMIEFKASGIVGVDEDAKFTVSSAKATLVLSNLTENQKALLSKNKNRVVRVQGVIEQVLADRIACKLSKPIQLVETYQYLIGYESKGQPEITALAAKSGFLVREDNEKGAFLTVLTETELSPRIIRQFEQLGSVRYVEMNGKVSIR